MKDSMDPITNSSDIDEFRRALARVPWFSSPGAPVSGAICIEDWDDWPGPEDRSVVSIHLAHQACFDSFFAETGDKEGLKTLWKAVLSEVMDAARHTVPFDETEDSWHGPTTAVWQAGWTAALVALHLEVQREMPADLLEQWKWFCAGRWPCAWDERSAGYIIF